MALSKTTAAITQLTASGTSTTLDASGSYRQGLYYSHSNGTGTVTAGGKFQIQVKPNGGSRFYNLGGAIPFGLTTAGVDSNVVEIPDEAGSVQLVYTAPTGATGFTLDAELGRMPTL